jgi:hypothetical protein
MYGLFSNIVHITFWFPISDRLEGQSPVPTLLFAYLVISRISPSLASPFCVRAHAGSVARRLAFAFVPYDFLFSSYFSSLLIY